MNTNLKNYSVTLNPQLVEEIKLDKGNLSKFLNGLLEDYFQKKYSNKAKRGNLSSTVKKLQARKLDPRTFDIDIKKAMGDYYAGKFGR